MVGHPELTSTLGEAISKPARDRGELRAVYGENPETFLRIRKEEHVDPEDISVNSFLQDLLFSDAVSTEH